MNKFRFYLCVFLTCLTGFLLMQCSGKKNCPVKTCKGEVLTTATQLEIGEKRDVCIFAKRAWNNTHVYLSPPFKYRLNVLPPDTQWCDGALKPFNADGHEVGCLLRASKGLLRKPDAAWFSLIGSLDKKRSHFFKIGKDTTFIPQVAGELTAFANDVRGFYAYNNYGVFVLRVTRLE